MYIYTYIYIYIYIHTYKYIYIYTHIRGPWMMPSRARSPPPRTRAKYYAPEITKVKFHWKMKFLYIFSAYPVYVQYIFSEIPLENATERPLDNSSEKRVTPSPPIKILYYTTRLLYYTILHHTLLYCTILYSILLLYFTLLYSTVLYSYLTQRVVRTPGRASSGSSAACIYIYIYIYIYT